MTQSSSSTSETHAHHFQSAAHEFLAAKEGMWLFLVTEVLMFGGLFIAYAVFRGLFPEAFGEAHTFLSIPWGTFNTTVLILSSVTLALAIHAIQIDQRDRSAFFIFCTLLLACVFLGVKYIEYSHKFHEGLLPAGFFHHPGIKTPQVPLFFSLYFLMTGLHGIHILIGIGLLAWVLKRTWRGDFSSQSHTPLELVGLYWHFVDLVWIFLFPLFYLVGES